MTIDVEDYFQVSAFDRVVSRDAWDTLPGRVTANTVRLLRIFDEAKIKATFFVLGWVADRHPDLVREIGSAGHELASHGYAHRLIYEQTPAEFREDIRRAKATIENIGGQRVLEDLLGVAPLPLADERCRFPIELSSLIAPALLAPGQCHVALVVLFARRLAAEGKR